jgi:hypothetical protein
MRIDTYLQRLGYVTYYDIFSGTLSIVNPRVIRGSPVPLVYLNDSFLSSAGRNSDFGILSFYFMSDIDYIEYEMYGVGGGIRGNAGFIKIYTDKTIKRSKAKDNVQTYKVPLTFNKDKKFYTPKYKLYTSSFFNEYGTIDWKPNISIQDDGSIDLKVLDTKNNFKLFIEGVAGDKHISKEILIQL